MKIVPKQLDIDIGCAGLVCFHNAHGRISDRCKGYVHDNDTPVATNNYGKDKIEEMPK